MIALPQLSPCSGCGRCCATIGLPPFEVPNPDLGRMPLDRESPNSTHDQRLTDTDTFLAMPAGLRAEHANLLRSLTSDPYGKPCAWFDPEVKRCRHYEYRPAVCRDWEPGSKGCQQARAGAGVSWRGDTPAADWRNPRRPATPWRRVWNAVRVRWRLRTDRRPVPRWAIRALLGFFLWPWFAYLSGREFRRHGIQGVRDLWAE